LVSKCQISGWPCTTVARETLGLKNSLFTVHMPLRRSNFHSLRGSPVVVIGPSGRMTCGMRLGSSTASGRMLSLSSRAD
jgi:hypothetical protein